MAVLIPRTQRRVVRASSGAPMPDFIDPQLATLQRRAPGAAAWVTVKSVPIGAGYVALFRLPGWDGTKPWEYRVTWATTDPTDG